MESKIWHIWSPRGGGLGEGRIKNLGLADASYDIQETKGQGPTV